jgi:hypothetical protein
MKIQELCQFDYPKESIDPTTSKKGTCVLTCLQMSLSYLFGRTWSQQEFYDKLVKLGIIRRDAYVHSYERAYDAFKPAMSRSGKWFFSDDRSDALKQIEKENPVFLYLGGHCILGESFDEETNKLGIVDPYYRFDKARHVLTRSIKRVGYFG